MINKSGVIYVELPEELQTAKRKDASICISISITTAKEMEKECSKQIEKFIADTTKDIGKDFKKFIEAFPYMKWLPINAVINSIVDNSNYPDK